MDQILEAIALELKEKDSLRVKIKNSPYGPPAIQVTRLGRTGFFRIINFSGVLRCSVEVLYDGGRTISVSRHKVNLTDPNSIQQLLDLIRTKLKKRYPNFHPQAPERDQHGNS